MLTQAREPRRNGLLCRYLGNKNERDNASGFRYRPRHEPYHGEGLPYAGVDVLSPSGAPSGSEQTEGVDDHLRRRYRA